jgi:transposase
VDRRKNGTKHHLLTDAKGTPMAASITPANRHDVNELLPLVDAVPAVKGCRGRPRRRPRRVQGDRAYGSAAHERELRRRHIQPVLAKRNTPHGSRLGVYRWVVERSLSWLHQQRRLRTRFERRADIHEALVLLGCIRICHNVLRRGRH